MSVTVADRIKAFHKSNDLVQFTGLDMRIKRLEHDQRLVFAYTNQGGAANGFATWDSLFDAINLFSHKSGHGAYFDAAVQTEKNLKIAPKYKAGLVKSKKAISGTFKLHSVPMKNAITDVETTMLKTDIFCRIVLSKDRNNIKEIFFVTGQVHGLTILDRFGWDASREEFS